MLVRLHVRLHGNHGSSTKKAPTIGARILTFPVPPSPTRTSLNVGTFEAADDSAILKLTGVNRRIRGIRRLLKNWLELFARCIFGNKRENTALGESVMATFSMSVDIALRRSDVSIAGCEMAKAVGQEENCGDNQQAIQL